MKSLEAWISEDKADFDKAKTQRKGMTKQAIIKNEMQKPTMTLIWGRSQ